ncbi:hypothetical protein B0H12DRAFT_264327 [Mycena haematopus]|nr:hypothetical protein B0H12DRAFT_264327 [Mycena haematopus]
MHLISHLRRRKRNQGSDKHDAEGNASGCILPQELVDECMAHLPTNELQTCALVCRSWCNTAQRLLFNVVSVSWTTSRYKRLEKTLRASPHLIQHVRTLALHRSSPLDSAAFEKVCTLPFTHLENVYIFHYSNVTLQSAHALQRLLSLSTLRLLDLQCFFMESAAFLAIWDGCSPSIRHLHFRCRKRSPDPVLPKQPSPSSWLKHGLCPLDISQLAVLAIDAHTSVLGWPRMAPSLQTIEALDFSSRAKEAINLSLLPNLLFLRIHSITRLTAPVALETLATVSSPSRIHQIVLFIETPDAMVCDQLDSEVNGLSVPYLSYVGLEMPIPEYNFWAPHFPRLCFRDLLGRTVTGNDWFEAQIHRRNILH